MTDCKNLDLAREWAEWAKNPNVYGGANDRARDAADLINGLPDSIISADDIYDIITEMNSDLALGSVSEHGVGYDTAVSKYLDALKALTGQAPAPRTMDEIEWDDDEHAGLCARHIHGDLVRMIGPAPDEEGYISCYSPLFPATVSARAGWALTPVPGTKIDLTPTSPIEDKPAPEQQALARDIFDNFPGRGPCDEHVHWAKHTPEDDVASATGGELTTQDVVDECRAVRKELAAPESATPRPEDVPVGEAWQVEAEGQVAIGYRADPETRLCWAVVYPHHTGRHWMYDSDVTLIARLVPETAEQDDEPEFDPAYTYQDKDGSTWTCYATNNMWICRDSRGWHVRADSVPPARFGPYTRIEKEDE